MKKYFLTCLCCGLVTTNSLASGIASNTASAPCTNNTLETYSGNSNLSADWQPNEIQLRWYNGNTLMNVQSSANTCVYDGALAVPQTAPTRTGYTFDGWTVRPEIDFTATIPLNGNGVYRYGKGESFDTHKPHCSYNGHGTDCNNSEFVGLQINEWKTGFNHGVIYGMTKCSAKSWTHAAVTNFTDNDLDSVAGDKKYCWCRVTGYKPNNSNIIYAPISVLSWVYNGEPSSNSVKSCFTSCVNSCAAYAWTSHGFLTALLTPAN